VPNHPVVPIPVAFSPPPIPSLRPAC
jgi:hypothetical protein